MFGLFGLSECAEEGSSWAQTIRQEGREVGLVRCGSS